MSGKLTQIILFQMTFPRPCYFFKNEPCDDHSTVKSGQSIIHLSLSLRLTHDISLIAVCFQVNRMDECCATLTICQVLS